MEIKNEREAKKIICELLGHNLLSVSVSSFGRRLYADVEYIDYKPERTVRREIEKAVPNLIVEEIHRDYSAHYVYDALFADNTTIYIESTNGRLEKMTPSEYVYDLMMDKDFSKQ